MKQALTKHTYQDLLNFIKIKIENTNQQIEQTKITSYWQIGESVSKHILENKDRADYGKQVCEKLAKDLKLSVSALHRAVKFYETYPIVAARPQFDWAHYKLLITVKDEDKRESWENRIARENLSSHRLQELLKKERAKSIKPKKPKIIEQLPISRGKLHTYRLLEDLSASKNTIFIDCGFDIRRTLDNPRPGSIKPDDIVSAKKQNRSYLIEKSAASQSELYTYPCRLERVIDGDTVWVHIDCGLDTWVRERVRLNSIDTPELKTPAGEKAKRFVQSILKNCEVFVIKTYKTDKYNRYLADIFFIEGESDPALIASEGELLNQTILEAGMGTVFEE